MTLAIILSVLGTVSICIPPLLKGKNMKWILLLVFSANALTGVSYALTMAFNGAASCCVGAAQTIINYFFDRKNKPIPIWLIAIYAVAFLVVNLFVFSKLADILALLAALAGVLAVCQKNGKRFRQCMFMNATLWIIYDAITFSFGPLCTHALQLGTNLFGIIMHDRKKNEE